MFCSQLGVLSVWLGYPVWPLAPAVATKHARIRWSSKISVLDFPHAVNALIGRVADSSARALDLLLPPTPLPKDWGVVCSRKSTSHLQTGLEPRAPTLRATSISRQLFFTLAVNSISIRLPSPLPETAASRQPIASA